MRWSRLWFSYCQKKKKGAKELLNYQKDQKRSPPPEFCTQMETWGVQVNPASPRGFRTEARVRIRGTAGASCSHLSTPRETEGFIVVATRQQLEVCSSMDCFMWVNLSPGAPGMPASWCENTAFTPQRSLPEALSGPGVCNGKTGPQAASLALLGVTVP